MPDHFESDRVEGETGMRMAGEFLHRGTKIRCAAGFVCRLGCAAMGP
jgi:hypothetical protein